MSVGDWLFGRVDSASQVSEDRALQVMPWGDWGGSYGTSSGRAVSQESASQVLTVFGCAQLLADTVATLPRGVFTDTPAPKPVTNPPAWFKKPNAYDSMTDLVGQMMWSFLFDGNLFAPYTVDASFRTNGIRVMNPRSVDIREENGIRRPYVDGKVYTGNLKHVKGLGPPGAVRGLSPVEAARQSISIAAEAEDFAARFYNNGAHLSGVITAPRDLTLPQARDMIDKFGRDHSGANAHKPGILDGGATWTPISITPEQAQFLESRQYQSAEIAGKMFLLDPSMLGIPITTNTLTYANLEQRGIHFVTFTLLRWLVRLEEFFTDLLPAPQYMKFNVAGLMRADLKTRYEAHQIALGGPQGTGKAWMTVEEVRDIEDLGPEPADLKLMNEKPPPAMVQQQSAPPVVA